jgi:hypothetical protein
VYRYNTHAGPALKARAYAGVARCALLASPPDVEGAREMVRMARKIVDMNFTEPEEIGAAVGLALFTTSLCSQIPVHHTRAVRSM